MEADSGWDAIVVGAGLGGLVAASRLLREGLRVLVLDAASHPGGTAYAFRRDGFLFPMGPLGFSHPRLVTEILRRTGMVEPPALKRVSYNLHAFGLSLPLSLPFPEMVAELSAVFPGERDYIGTFFHNLKTTYASLLSMSGIHLERFHLSAHEEPGLISYPQPHPFLETPPGPSPRGSALKRRFGGNIPSGTGIFPPPGEKAAGDWRLRRILGSMGTGEPYSNPALLAVMWNLLCEEGIHYPEVGMHGLCDLLAAPLGWRPLGVHDKHTREGEDEEEEWRKSVEKAWGGELPSTGDTREGRLLLRSPAARIEVRRGRVRGVALRDGTFLEAPVVISNADFRETFLALLDRDAVPEELRRAVGGAALTPSKLQVCLGFVSSLVNLSAFRRGSRVIHRRADGPESRPQREPDWSSHRLDPQELSGAEIEMTLLSADDPSLAPSGRQVLVMRTTAEFTHFEPFRPPGGGRIPAYAGYKISLAEALIGEASRLIPHLDTALEKVDVATPLTFEERGRRSRGAVAGWTWRGPSGGLRGAAELVRTPVAGLYMAGHQAFTMLVLGGVPTAMLSGFLAAEHALAGSGPCGEMPIPAY